MCGPTCVLGGAVCVGGRYVWCYHLSVPQPGEGPGQGKPWDQGQVVISCPLTPPHSPSLLALGVGVTDVSPGLEDCNLC